jgi:lysyl-tRNA synthetase class I
MRLAFDNVTFSTISSEYFSSGTNIEIFEAIFKQFSDKTIPYIQEIGTLNLKAGKNKPFTLEEFLEVYEPEVLKHVIGHKLPNSFFELFKDNDVLQNYDSYDMTFDTKLPLHKGKPFYFPNLVHYLSRSDLDRSKLLSELDLNGCDINKLEQRIACAKNWLTKYPSSKYDLSFRDYPLEFSDREQNILSKFALALKNCSSELEIQNVINEHSKLNGTKPFFDLTYRSLLDRQGGPKLVKVIMQDKEKAIDLLEGKL